MFIAIDFDGTVVKHEYPKIGEEIPGAIEGLKQMITHGHKLILLTMRAGNKLDEAINYLKGKGIELYAVNENPTQKHWTQSPKVYAELYIDDASIGCPLVHVANKRSYVDWNKVMEYYYMYTPSKKRGTK